MRTTLTSPSTATNAFKMKNAARMSSLKSMESTAVSAEKTNTWMKTKNARSALMVTSLRLMEELVTLYVTSFITAMKTRRTVFKIPALLTNTWKSQALVLKLPAKTTLS